MPKRADVIAVMYLTFLIHGLTHEDAGFAESVTASAMLKFEERG